jgi:hypothetical protein
MFKSIKYLRHDSKLDSYIYLLTDNEFECEARLASSPARSAATCSRAAAAAVAAVEYDRRNLPVGKNLLLIAKFYYKKYNINNMLSWQDEFIPIYLKEINYPDFESKWEQWKKERDYYLVMA